MGLALGVMLVLDMGLAFTGSRTPWGQVLLLTGLGLWGLRAPAPSFTTTDRPASWWRRAWFPLLMLPALVLTGLVVTWANHRWGWGLADPAQRLQGPHQLSPRLALWQSGWILFRQAPWLGTGWGDYAWHQYQAVLSIGPVEPAQSAHNLMLDLLARTGLLGTLLILAPLAMWGWRALQGRPSAGRTFMLGVVGTLLVHAMVEFPETYLFFLLPVAFLIGRWGERPGPTEVLVATGVHPSRPSMDRVWGGTVTALAGATLVAVLAVGVGYRQAEQAQDDARIPALGTVKKPHTQGLGRLFDPWLDAMSWPDRLEQQPLAALDPGFDPRMARTLALAPRVDHLRRLVIALAQAGRNEAAWDAAQRWALLSQGYRRWPQEWAAAMNVVAHDPTSPGLKTLGERLQTLPVPLGTARP